MDNDEDVLRKRMLCSIRSQVEILTNSQLSKLEYLLFKKSSFEEELDKEKIK
jgi:hypothetical protein